MAAEASSSLLHCLLCATPPAWQLVRVSDRTGADAKRGLCMEAEWGRPLLPGQCVLSGARNSPHPGIGGPIQRKCLKTHPD